MKSIIATIVLLGTSILPTLAEEPLPTVRGTQDWLIISGTGYQQSGPLPWTHAIRKDTILSVTIAPDFRIIHPEGQQGPMKFHDTPKDEIAKLAAGIEITTSELLSSGGPTNKRYTIGGLTNTTAPVLLEKILEAIQKPTE